MDIRLIFSQLDLKKKDSSPKWSPDYRTLKLITPLCQFSIFTFPWLDIVENVIDIRVFQWLISVRVCQFLPMILRTNMKADQESRTTHSSLHLDVTSKHLARDWASVHEANSNVYCILSRFRCLLSGSSALESECEISEDNERSASPMYSLFTVSKRALSTFYLKSFLFVMLISLCLSPANSSANIRQLEKEILDRIIGGKVYDARIRPSGNVSAHGNRDGPSMVYVNILIRSISKISDLDMEYSVQVTFRESWIDSRLRFDNMNGQIRYLVMTDPKKVWRPDLFFKNEKEGHFHEIILPNVLMRIYPDGTVLYSIRISLVLACPMNLKYYPLDKQVCGIQMASYAYSTEDLMFVWKKEEPVQINTKLHLPRFTLEKYVTDYCTSTTNTVLIGEWLPMLMILESAILKSSGQFEQKEEEDGLCQVPIHVFLYLLVSSLAFVMTLLLQERRTLRGNTVSTRIVPTAAPDRVVSNINQELGDPTRLAIIVGSYSCLEVKLLFKREFSYYLIQIYIPCCMLVIVSWVSFWLDPNAIPARVSLGVTTLLTMATSISGINSSLPPVSYTKAIDVWTGVCLTFVFGALLEFALVNYASRSDAHRAALKQQQAAFAAQRKWELEHAALEVDHMDERTNSAFAMRPLVRQHGDFSNEKMRQCEIHMQPKRNWCKRWLSKFPTRSKRIDVISRIFFPLMFALFNLVYWTTYLFREDMQDLG